MLKRRSHHASKKIVTNAVKYATPHFFIQMVWSYTDSLWLEKIRPGQIQQFNIQQTSNKCTISFSQDTPAYQDKWHIKLMTEQLALPDELVIINHNHQHILCLPNETAKYLA